MLNIQYKIDSVNLHDSAQRDEWGRYLYCIQQQNKKYWLKYQLNVAQYQQKQSSFEYELKVYNLLHSIQTHLILDYQIIAFQDLKLDQQYWQSTLWQHQQHYPHLNILILADSQSIFNQAPPDDFAQCKQIILSVMDCLANIHQAGVIHGDIKAEHFVQYQQSVYLIDFEQAETMWLAKPAEQTLTATPHYMASELFYGQAKNIQSDIYALGIVLYEWLSQQTIAQSKQQQKHIEQKLNYRQWQQLHQQGIVVKLEHHYQVFQPILKAMLAPLADRVSSMAEVLEMMENINYQ
ncbi:protein kinase [Moraxella sp. ZY210820]|uniref:protein kinase domain-containing protein n=1 Tax=unclassified Moraxella TaxID=2685852 RepID=UPI0027305F3D|nr:protein kinase [Moraxella sp. ZY210820]WLF84662.1 protein kinase [Moraxella sp. ZY210820]